MFVAVRFLKKVSWQWMHGISHEICKRFIIFVLPLSFAMMYTISYDFSNNTMLCAMLIITFYCDLMRKYISVMIHAWLNILQLFVICCSVLCMGNWWHLWRIKRYSEAHVYRLVFRANILHDTHMRDPSDMNSYNRVFIMHPPLRKESIMTTAFTTNRWNMLFA